MSGLFVAERLGRFISETGWAAIPAAVRREAPRALLNHVGCALGVAHDPAVTSALAVMRSLSGPPVATVFGHAVRLDPLSAAFVNCIAGNLLDYDDTHLATVVHPAAPVAPVALALGEARSLSGEAVLHALLLGMEVECRIGLGVSPGHYDRGWHITSTCGVFGAAAAAAKLLGLDAERCGHALGLAASQSAGIVENLPSAGKNASMGNAARNGLLAALLAEAGWQAAPAAIEGKLGWARAMGDTPDCESMAGALGERWEVARITYKPYAAGIVFHAVIEAALALDLAPDDVTELLVEGDALLLARGDREVRNERDARVSIHHAAALGIVRRRAGVADFEMPAVEDPALGAFRSRVRARCDPGLPRGAARLTATLRDGTSHSRLVIHPSGSEANPMSDAALNDKFRDNLRIAGIPERADTMIAALRGLEAAPNLEAAASLLIQGAAA
ncbi:MmgE/PrpD family protein [Sediminicoccus sp. KRV36]|uniref:MmgE/PrpD family protein n=1 Tax=Sediminicoccus sp. KRV36 TaxID=3133721 RepID=UPI00200CA595|nr:MmgE/PrpD family protein [Sediminicoccus rosea]UPY38905.1 MmgE/PrpD family protein [Sediminicoccus rosea]